MDEMQARQVFSWFRSSLPVRLALAVAIFVGAIAAGHFSSLDRLVHVDQVSSEVRNRWLDSIRLLGDVNDHVSDLRAAEAEVLLSRDADARERHSTELINLTRVASQAMDRYQEVPHDAEETLAFSRFAQRWTEHVEDAQRLTSLLRSGDNEAAASVFDGPARASFQSADAELRRLIGLTEGKAEAARNKAADAIDAAQRWISDLIFGILVLFVGIVAYLWWAVSRPILRLSGLMRRLARHDTDFSVPFQSWRDEVGHLARALGVFRRNTIELLESRKRLSSQAEILARSLDKERALATEQRNFISTISHEFRTPLMAIDGHAQRLITTRERAKPPDILDRAEKIRAAVFRMTSLVASLMDAIELARGNLQARIRPFDLKYMLDSLARYYAEIGVGGGLEARIGDIPGEVKGDPELLYQVFSNLVSNAFKYSPDGKAVTLSAARHDGVVEIAVEDRGVGIPRDEIGRVRERYYRASNVGSIPGTGLGLHLVDEIVRQHGGRVEIESEEGKGTRVAVLLPLDGPPELAERDVAQDLMRGGRSGDGKPDGGGPDGARLPG